MSFDITIAAAKSREKTAVSALEPSYGDAGVSGTRRAPVLLSDKSSRLIEEFAALVPVGQRASYVSAVMARLSGSTGFEAVRVSCVSAAHSGFVAKAVLVEHGLVNLDSRVPKQHHLVARGIGR